MKKVLLLAGLALAASLVMSVAVHAITFGVNDNGRHPFVGSLVAVADDGDKFQLCSGTLVSPTIFVTASHCLVGLEPFGIVDVQVTFADEIDDDADGLIDPGVTLLDGTPHPHPEFGAGGGSDAHDVAVFEIEQPGVSLGTYAELPTAGLLDGVDKKTAEFTTVGYGTVRDDKTGGPHSLELGTRRKVATQDLLSLQKAWATFSMNPSTGSGGTCFGDSGGPHFLGAGGTETTTIVAVTVTGDRFCRATDKTYRIDTASALSFLDDFVANS